MKHKKTRKIKMTMQFQLSMIFLLTICLPLLIFGSFLYKEQTSILENEVVKSVTSELDQITDRLDLKFSQIQSVSNLFYLDEDLINFLTLHGEKTQYQGAEDVHKALNKYRAGVNNLYFNTAVIAPDGRVFTDSSIYASEDRFPLEDSRYTKMLENRPFDMFWVRDPELDRFFGSAEYSSVYLIRQLHNPKGWEPVGTLILKVSELEIQKLYSGFITWNQSLYLLDDKDIISNVDNMNNLDFHNKSDLDFWGYSDAVIEKDGKTRVLINYSTMKNTQWKVVLYSDLKELLSVFSKAGDRFALIIFVYLLATIILSSFLAKLFVKPINHLYKSMSEVKKGDLTVVAPVFGNNEITNLTVQFNDMVDEIRELMLQVVTEEELKREAEIKSLQAQINPHFLYNTLASIRYMIYTGNKEDSDTIIVALTRIMKNALSDQKEFITIEKEIDILNDYIDIQRLTLVKPLTVEIDVKEDILSCQTVKLLLQPIVENAFMHGFKPKKGDCYLKISGASVGSVIEFKIEDNGVGMVFAPDLRSEESQLPLGKRGIGLRNVDERIVLTFGEKYGVTVVSEKDVGTTVTLRIPYIEQEGDCNFYEHTNR